MFHPALLALAQHYGFTPRACRPYRAQTKGKVESGVKYFKRNFLPGRVFLDDRDLQEQLAQWMAEIADVRILHHAITLNIRGNSYRLKDKLKAGLVRPAEATE